MVVYAATCGWCLSDMHPGTTHELQAVAYAITNCSCDCHQVAGDRISDPAPFLNKQGQRVTLGAARHDYELLSHDPRPAPYNRD